MPWGVATEEPWMRWWRGANVGRAAAMRDGESRRRAGTRGINAVTGSVPRRPVLLGNDERRETQSLEGRGVARDVLGATNRRSGATSLL